MFMAIVKLLAVLMTIGLGVAIIIRSLLYIFTEKPEGSVSPEPEYRAFDLLNQRSSGRNYDFIKGCRWDDADVFLDQQGQES